MDRRDLTAAPDDDEVVVLSVRPGRVGARGGNRRRGVVALVHGVLCAAIAVAGLVRTLASHPSGFATGYVVAFALGAVAFLRLWAARDLLRAARAGEAGDGARPVVRSTPFHRHPEA